MPHSERPASMQAYATREMQKKTEEMFDLAEAGDVRGVRAVMESIDVSHPGYLQTTAGRYNLRTAAVCAARYGRLDVIPYLCGERRVPPMAMPPDEIGTFLISIFSLPAHLPNTFFSCPPFPSYFSTPLILLLKASFCFSQHHSLPFPSSPLSIGDTPRLLQG